MPGSRLKARNSVTWEKANTKTTKAKRRGHKEVTKSSLLPLVFSVATFVFTFPRTPLLLQRTLRFAPASKSVLQAENAQLGARTNAPQRQTSQKRIRIHGQSRPGKAHDCGRPTRPAATFLLHA